MAKVCPVDERLQKPWPAIATQSTALTRGGGALGLVATAYGVIHKNEPFNEPRR